MRKISREGENVPQFPTLWGIEERDKFYQSISFSGSLISFPF
jgi:hypothetical protein